MEEVKPKIQITDYLIDEIAFNYAKNFTYAKEYSQEFNRMVEAVKYGIGLGLASEKKVGDELKDI